jgi:hypothetical protein
MLAQREHTATIGSIPNAASHAIQLLLKPNKREENANFRKLSEVCETQNP